MLYTADLLRALEARGVATHPRQLQRWLKAGLFRGAKQSPRGEWTVPEEAVEIFIPPTDGSAALRQPWAEAYLTAFRTFDPDPLAAAGVTEAALRREVEENHAFQRHLQRLLINNFTIVSASGEGLGLEPREWPTDEEIQSELRSLRKPARDAFARAVEVGYLHSDRCPYALRSVFWQWCKLHNAPCITQIRDGRTYTNLEADIWTVVEADGTPRLLSDAADEEIRAVFDRFTYDGKPVDRPDWHSRSIHEMYLRYQTADLAGEIYAIYRRHYPAELDPPAPVARHDDRGQVWPRPVDPWFIGLEANAARR